MTRINCVPVECLSYKHLLAEYKEITRPFNKVIKRIEKYGVDQALDTCVIPECYTLGEGHETFFFNKLGWLYERYLSVTSELIKRNFNIDEDKFESILEDICDNLRYGEYWNQWDPSPEDMYLNMARLCKRSNLDNVIEELRSAK